MEHSCPKRSRKENCNQRIKDSFSLRRFLCFNTGEFIAFHKDGVEEKFARIRRHSNSDGALEISLYALESSFHESLKIRVLTQNAV
jgi:hypothetical protein